MYVWCDVACSAAMVLVQLDFDKSRSLDHVIFCLGAYLVRHFVFSIAIKVEEAKISIILFLQDFMFLQSLVGIAFGMRFWTDQRGFFYLFKLRPWPRW